MGIFASSQVLGGNNNDGDAVCRQRYAVCRQQYTSFGPLSLLPSFLPSFLPSVLPSSFPSDNNNNNNNDDGRLF